MPLKHRSQPLIELIECSILFDTHPALDAVTFALRPGERWALVGPNGSGKTQLLKLLRGDVWPTPTGRERRVYRFDGAEDSEPAGHKERIAYVGPERQDKYSRYGWDFSVQAVVTTGLFDEDIPLTKPTRAQQAKVERILKRFGLWGLRQRRLLSLSYGQRRLALVARAFASAAPVLLLDEVFNGLDTATREKLRRALEAPRAGHTWILTTHRQKELPRNITHVAYIEGGRIVRQGPAGEVPAHAPRRRKRIAKTVLKPATFARRRAGGEGWLLKLQKVALYRDYKPVIRSFDWTLARGEHCAILGANGSGKSTLLTLLYGDMHPALGGTIERAGFPVGGRIEDWKRRVGWVSPDMHAEHAFAKSIEELVISGRYASVGLNQKPTAHDRKLARKWLAFFGIEHLRERGARQVSYGQMRLALFARAMINEPELLLLDEPCTGLDGDVREDVLAVLQRLAEAGTQIVMAVHDPEDIIPAVRQVLHIRRGRVHFEERV